MRRSDSGRGYPKAIFALAVLSALAYVAFKTLPIYVHNYDLQDHIRQVAIYAMAGQRPSAETVRNDIVAYARDLDLPVSPDNVKVVFTGTKITIDLDYTVHVDLMVYTLPMHFTPSAENRSL